MVLKPNIIHIILQDILRSSGNMIQHQLKEISIRIAHSTRPRIFHSMIPRIVSLRNPRTLLASILKTRQLTYQGIIRRINHTIITLILREVHSLKQIQFLRQIHSETTPTQIHLQMCHQHTRSIIRSLIRMKNYTINPQ